MTTKKVNAQIVHPPFYNLLKTEERNRCLTIL